MLAALTGHAPSTAGLSANGSEKALSRDAAAISPAYAPVGIAVAAPVATVAHQARPALPDTALLLLLALPFAAWRMRFACFAALPSVSQARRE